MIGYLHIALTICHVPLTVGQLVSEAAFGVLAFFCTIISSSVLPAQNTPHLDLTKLLLDAEPLNVL